MTLTRLISTLRDGATAWIAPHWPIPADAAELSLTGQYFIKTVEDTEQAYDVTYVQLVLDDEVLWLAATWTNLDATTGWKSFDASTTDLAALRGKTVTFIAYSRTDPNGVTSFWLDNLELVASCGR